MKYWAIIFFCISLAAFRLPGLAKLRPKPRWKLPNRPRYSYNKPHYSSNKPTYSSNKPTYSSNKPTYSLPSRANARQSAKLKQWMAHDNLLREAKIARWTANNAKDVAEQSFKIWRQNPNSLSARKTFEDSLKYAEFLKKHAQSIDGKLFESQNLLSKYQ